MRRYVYLLALGQLTAIGFAACIDVGHEAETGCLKDPSLPGCKLPTSSAGGSTSSSATTATPSTTTGAGGSSSEGGAAGANTSPDAQAGAGAE